MLTVPDRSAGASDMDVSSRSRLRVADPSPQPTQGRPRRPDHSPQPPRDYSSQSIASEGHGSDAGSEIPRTNRMRRQDLEAQLHDIAYSHLEVENKIDGVETELQLVTEALARADERAAASAVKLQEAEGLLATEAAATSALQKKAAASEERLHGMVPVDQLQASEKEVDRLKKMLHDEEREARQLRMALADAVKTGADSSPLMQSELEVLRESTEAAKKKMLALEELNQQFEHKLEQLNKEIETLRTGTHDLRSEEALMRELIMEQNLKLLEKVEDLTEEDNIASQDRKELLRRAAEINDELERTETRIESRPMLERQCRQLEAQRQALEFEVQRLRRSNSALCEQVLGEEAEGDFAGCLCEGLRALEMGLENLTPAEQEVCAEVGRLVRGQLLVTTQGGSLREDAGEIALRLQILLRERDEGYWEERQRLTERVNQLERASGTGRTGGMLAAYAAQAQGKAQPGAAKGKAGAAAAAGSGFGFASGLSTLSAWGDQAGKSLQRIGKAIID